MVKGMICFILGLMVASAMAEEGTSGNRTGEVIIDWGKLSVNRLLTLAGGTDDQGIIHDLRMDREGRVICSP